MPKADKTAQSADKDAPKVQLPCTNCGATPSSVVPSTSEIVRAAGAVSRNSATSDITVINSEPKAAEGETTKGEVKTPTRIGRYIKSDKQKILVDEARWTNPSNLANDGQYAIVVDDKVKVDRRGNETSRIQELKLVSAPLVNTFVSVVQYYPGISLEGSEIVLPAPYAPLFFSYEQLREKAQEDESNSGFRADFNVLDNFYTRWVKTEHDNIRKRIQNNVVLFEDLWAVFRPGDQVVGLDEFGDPCLHVLGATEYRKGEDTGSRHDHFSIRRFRRFSVDLSSITWDKASGMFQGITVTRSIRIFSEARKINSLPFYPLNYYENGTREKVHALREALHDRGNQWKQLISQKPSCRFYDGAARSTAVNSNDFQYLRERVMVDASATLAVMGPGVNYLGPEHYTKKSLGLVSGGATRSQNIEYEWNVHGAGLYSALANFSDFPRDGVFTELQAQLCPSHVLCYGIDSRSWYDVSVSKLKVVEWQTEGLKNLVVDPDTKDMLTGLVQQHRKNRLRGLNDIVRSKGKGLIVVLYGNPGVGKTLTAETVAEYTKKPLYPINIGELSSQTDLVTRLGMHFSRASRWDAVLLLDEADVLLERRSYENLQRNAVVSVFLRMLEYYEGIIFLTTNRLLTMDSAFESRIQLAIRLPDLAASSRRQIWHNLINRLDPEEEFGKKELLDRLDELEKWELNGRQIRNVLSTAESFALGTQHRRGALRFKMVQNMANEVIRFHEFFEEGAHERKAQLGVINPRQFQERRRF
ncbi:putative atpase aaa+ type core [Cladorrhinum sp. PSN332]|nr:putative atpase aaa+ type core [Cladorrhinum sp. PSN332]